MTEQQERITACVNKALCLFNQNEEYLISRDVSERCICARFAWYLQNVLLRSEFHEYVVDVEYNRGSKGNEYAAKCLIALDDMKDRSRQRGNSNKRKTNKIVVDLIAHKRGYREDIGFDNLLCIEMKKLYKNPNLESDRFRLECMTNPMYGFGYKAGFMIVAIADKATETYQLRVDRTYYDGFASSD